MICMIMIMIMIMPPVVHDAAAVIGRAVGEALCTLALGTIVKLVFCSFNMDGCKAKLTQTLLSMN